MKTENIIRLTIAAILLYFTAIFLLMFSGLELGPYLIKPNAAILTIITGIAYICYWLFPFWSVPLYIRSQEVSSIAKFRESYRRQYLFLVMVGLGLLTWCGAHGIIDFFWFLGMIMIVPGYFKIFQKKKFNI